MAVRVGATIRNERLVLIERLDDRNPADFHSLMERRDRLARGEASVSVIAPKAAAVS